MKAAEAGDRASRADSRTPPNLVLGASLLLAFVRTGGFGGDALVLGAVGVARLAVHPVDSLVGSVGRGLFREGLRPPSCLIYASS
jgi:hypothetical protein